MKHVKVRVVIEREMVLGHDYSESELRESLASEVFIRNKGWYLVSVDSKVVREELPVNDVGEAGHVIDLDPVNRDWRNKAFDLVAGHAQAMGFPQSGGIA